MLNAIRQLFTSPAKVDLRALVQNGARIVDVRTESEYKQGHIKGSVNIPLASLAQQVHRINKQKPVITCCASGMRSAQARNQLMSMGFNEVYNGGGWMSLQRKIM